MEAAAYRSQKAGSQPTGKLQHWPAQGQGNATTRLKSPATGSAKRPAQKPSKAATKQARTAAQNTDKLAKSVTPQAKKRERDQAKQANAKRRQRRARRARKGSYLLLLLFVLAGGFTLSVTVFFNVTSVTVSEQSPYTAEEFMAEMGVQAGDNLWRLPIHQLEQDFLAKKVNLDGVNLVRQFPNTLQVTMIPAKEQWRLLEGGRYYSVSQGGRLLGVSDTSSPEGAIAGEEGSVLVSGISVADRAVGEFLTEVPEYQTLMHLWEVAQSEQVTGITGIFLAEGNFSLALERRILAKLGGLSELSYKMTMMQYLRTHQIAPTEYGVLDLYVPAKGFFEQMTPEELAEKFPLIQQ